MNTTTEPSANWLVLASVTVSHEVSNQIQTCAVPERKSFLKIE